MAKKPTNRERRSHYKKTLAERWTAHQERRRKAKTRQVSNKSNGEDRA